MRNGKYENERQVAYYKDDVLHREDGPAIQWKNGPTQWRLNGELHRVGGPAVEFLDGSTEWWLHGQKHREDGPAMAHARGPGQWWIHGKRLTEEEVQKHIGTRCQSACPLKAEYIRILRHS
ncbi:hypothetical protein M4R22_02735 [Acidovorax sp. GBBC 3334]|uniref:hypothetical protein n=1 Tax=Acidovorax sp. GBBC 3334 TaxID=2940496 RepID=UPI00230496D2|nr:hypothetical protein [Acidovorax sp. GBBC 3334]MDA8453672.1 hypothetical protein [Acidovorax sp. GBBC 3334]